MLATKQNKLIYFHMLLFIITYFLKEIKFFKLFFVLVWQKEGILCITKGL